MIEYLYTRNISAIENGSYLDLQLDNTAINYIKFLLNFLIDELTTVKQNLSRNDAHKLFAMKNPEDRVIKKGEIYKSLFQEEKIEKDSDFSDSEGFIKNLAHKKQEEIYNQDRYSEESENDDDEDSDGEDLYIDKPGESDDDDDFLREKRVDYTMDDILKNCSDLVCAGVVKSLDEFKEFERVVKGIQNSNMQFYNFLIEALPRNKRGLIIEVTEYKKMVLNKESTKVRKIKKIIRNNN
jgi:hypothetical protein